MRFYRQAQLILSTSTLIRDNFFCPSNPSSKSGGWTNCVDFDLKGARVSQYRNGRGGGKNNSSLDDDQTQPPFVS